MVTVETKNRMKKFLIFLVAFSFSLVSCQKIFFNGDESTRELVLQNFHIVSVKGIYNIVLIQDSLNKLVITGKNDISSIEAFTEGDTLIINNRKRMSLNPDKNTLALHFSSIEYLETYDPASISNADTIKADQFVYVTFGGIAEIRLVIKCNYLYVYNSPNTLGNFYFIGKANDCSLFNAYGCSIFADSLLCKNAEIINESIGDVHVNAKEHIKAFIRGPGNICYYGNPVIEVADKRGNGRMIKLK
jgi:hypothetical protein